MLVAIIETALYSGSVIAIGGQQTAKDELSLQRQHASFQHYESCTTVNSLFTQSDCSSIFLCRIDCDLLLEHDDNSLSWAKVTFIES